MSDPRRWRENDGGAPPGVRDVLRGARSAPNFDPAARARSRHRVERLAVVPVTVSLVGLWAKGLAVAAALGLLGAAAYLGAESTPPPPPPAPTRTPTHRAAPRAAPRSPVVAPAPAPVAPPAPPPRPPSSRPVDFRIPPRAAPPVVAPAVRVEAPEATPSAPTEPPPPVATPPSFGGPTAPHVVVEEDPLVREDRLLDRARRALEGDPERTLELLATYDETCPAGLLAEERAFLEVDALRRLGRASAMRTRADAMLARYPRSAYATRVRAMLATTP